MMRNSVRMLRGAIDLALGHFRHRVYLPRIAVAAEVKRIVRKARIVSRGEGAAGAGKNAREEAIQCLKLEATVEMPSVCAGEKGVEVSREGTTPVLSHSIIIAKDKPWHQVFRV
jgi:hypothetical protein